MLLANTQLTPRKKLAWIKERNFLKESTIGEAPSDAKNVTCIMNYELLSLFTMGNSRGNTVLSCFCIIVFEKGFVFFAHTTVNCRCFRGEYSWWQRKSGCVLSVNIYIFKWMNLVRYILFCTYTCFYLQVFISLRHALVVENSVTCTLIASYV